MSRTFAYLQRLHATAKESFLVGSVSVDIPVRQCEVVEFNLDGDFHTVTAEAVIAAAAPLAAVRPDLPSSDWQDWKLQGLRDAYEFAAPPATRVAPDSPVARLLAEQRELHPNMLNASEPFVAYQAFEQWFCTGGNGMYWKDGVYMPTYLRGLERDPSVAPSAEQRRERAYHDALRRLAPQPPVQLYPLSHGYGALFELTAHPVEDSWLIAAVELCQHLLSRPVWENHGYDAHELLGVEPGKHLALLSGDERWRQALLADGAHYRAIVQQAYAGIVLGPHAKRFASLGLDPNFHCFPLNYRLPPRVRFFS